MVSETDGRTPPRISRQRRTGGILASTVSLLIQFAILIVKARRKKCFADPSHNPFVISISFYVVISLPHPYSLSIIPPALPSFLPPLSLLPPFVIPAPLRHSCPPSSFRRKPESRGSPETPLRFHPGQPTQRDALHRRHLEPGPAHRTASGRCRSGVHPTVRRPYARLAREARHDGKRHRAGLGVEKMETGLEVESIEKRSPLWRDLSAEVV